MLPTQWEQNLVKRKILKSLKRGKYQYILYTYPNNNRVYLSAKKKKNAILYFINNYY